MAKMDLDISIIIPVYNSQDCIFELFSKIDNTMKEIDKSYEIIFVDDASIDDSWETLENLTKDLNQNITSIKLSKNVGQHDALLCGLHHAKGNIVVTLDDDLQHPPEEIKKLMNKYFDGFDLVYGSAITLKHSIIRNMSAKFVKFILAKILNKEYLVGMSAFRLFSRHLVKDLNKFNFSKVNIDGLLSLTAQNITSTPVNHAERIYGKSGYSFLKLLTHFIRLAFGFSAFPLQIASILGFVLSFFGFIILILIITNWLINGSVVQGFVFLSSIISIFGGVQLLILGIIGEYISRIYFGNLNLNTFSIKNIITKSKSFEKTNI